MVNLSQPEDADRYNQQMIDRLVRDITRLGGEFLPILVVCNYQDLQHRMVAQLRQHCPVPIHAVSLPRRTKLLSIALQTRLHKTPDALMVFDLAKVHDLKRVLSQANRIREEFRDAFPFPLLFWLDDPTLKEITRSAPDFKNWFSLPIRFELSTQELVDRIRQEAQQAFDHFLNHARLLDSLTLNPHRQHQHDAEVEAALRDLHQRGLGLEPELMAGVDFLQGRQALARNRLGQARKHFEHSLAFFGAFENEDPSQTQNPKPKTQNSPNPLYQACLRFYLGLTWRVRAREIANRVEHVPYCQLAREYFRQSLQCFYECDRLDLAAQYITPLAETLQQLEEWDELEEVVQTALALHDQYPDPLWLANDYGLRAIVATAREQWSQAKDDAQAALDILGQIAQQGTRQQKLDLNWARRHLTGSYLLTLAKAQHHLNEIEAAIATLDIARQTLQPRHDPKLYLDILEEARSLQYRQRDYLSAFRLKQEHQSLAQQFGFRAFLGAGQLQPQCQPTNPMLPDEEADPLDSQEIAASGRQKDVKALVDRLGQSNCKLVVIHGPSGVGKSSIINAALVPKLRKTRLTSEYRPTLPILVRSYKNWEVTLLTRLQGATNDQIEEHARPGSSMLKTIRSDNEAKEPPSSASLLAKLNELPHEGYFPVLIFDQFEEFFFDPNHAQPEQRLPFYRFLRDCLQAGFVKVVLALREDYLHYLLEFDRLAPTDLINEDILSKDIRYYLGDFTAEEAHNVITKASQRSGFQLDKPLIDQVVKDLAGTLGLVRPIELQIVGAELQDSNLTSLDCYDQLGDKPKEALVENFLQRAIRDCGEANERIAKLVLYLLTDDQGHRLQKTRDELAQELRDWGVVTEHSDPQLLPEAGDLNTSPQPPTPNPQPLDLVLEVLVGSGIVLTIPETPLVYQIIHDYLVSYVRQQVKPSWFLQLEQEKHQRQRAEQERDEALAQRLREAQRNVKVLTGLGSVLALVTVLAINFGIRAQIKGLEAQIISAEAVINTDPFSGLLKSLRIIRQVKQTPWMGEDVSNQAQLALYRTVYSTSEQNQIDVDQNPDTQVAVRDIAFSPDGQQVATASSDGTARLWSLQGKQIAEFKGHTSAVLSVAFSPDGQQVATASYDGTARLWSLQGKQIAEFKGHTSAVLSVAFSPDGQQVATASYDGTARLWSLQGKQIAEFKGHTSAVWSVAFSPDGQQVATASSDGTARLWSLQGKQIAEFKGHTSAVLSVAFSPDGQQVATASSDGTARLWSLQGKQIAEFKGHTSEVLSVAFSPDGQQVATASRDNTAKLWRVETVDQLVARACAWVRPYLLHNPGVSAEDRRLCDGV